MKDYKHKRLQASCEVRKQERLDKYLSIGLSALGALNRRLLYHLRHTRGL